MRSRGGGGLLAVLVALGGCVPPEPPPPAPPPAPLPELIVPLPPPAPIGRAPEALRSNDPLAARPPGDPVTLSARNVDVRVLLLALAEAAGISLVLDPAIEGRVTFNFTDVPAIEALRAVLTQAELGLSLGPPEPPIGPVVFYVVPVDIEKASVDLIRARFRVSPEVAELIVRNRIP